MLEHSNDLPICITKREQIDDGGHLRMDNISHVCVGYFLMSPTHHDGIFFPTTYLVPYGIKLVIKKITFQNPLKCKDKNMIWEDGILHWRNATYGHNDRHSSWVGWVMLMSKRLGNHL